MYDTNHHTPKKLESHFFFLHILDLYVNHLLLK